jgi:hypothetical protein
VPLVDPSSWRIATSNYYGFPQELQAAVDCIREDREPPETGEDGKEVLRAVYAAYESARTGQKVLYPYEPPAWATKPIYNWKPWLAPNCPEDLREAMSSLT